MTIRKWVVVFCVLGLFAAVASAEWERTISAWDTKLPDQGGVRVSVWSGYWEWDHGGEEVDASLYLDYGILDRWSVSVSPGFLSWDQDGMDSESGISDTDLFSTYRFADEADAGLDLAIMGGASLPTGDDDKGLGNGDVEPKLSLLASKTLGPIIIVGNAGGRWITDAGDGEEDYTVYAALEGICPLNDKLSINANTSASTSRWEGNDDPVDVGLGVRFAPIEQAFCLAAGYYCLTDNYDWGAQVAAGYEF